MRKAGAVRIAIDITKTIIQSCDIKVIPGKDAANEVASFIETLTERLQKLDDGT